MVKLSRSDRLYNLFTLHDKDKIKGRCRYCYNPLFNFDSDWAKDGVCVFCHEAEERVKKHVQDLSKKYLYFVDTPKGAKEFLKLEAEGKTVLHSDKISGSIRVFYYLFNEYIKEEELKSQVVVV